MSDDLFNVRQTAKELGVHENTVRNLEKRGELKAVRLPSGVRRFRKADIARMRDEMWGQFAPDTEMPAKRSHPANREEREDG